MERTLSSEERIRRAEEIYQRRKMQGGVRVSTSSVNSKKQPEYSLFKKLALQIAICLLIYFIFYLIQNSNYIFSEDVLNKTREFLSYDINFQNVFKQMGDYYNEHIAGLLGGGSEEKKNLNEQVTNENLDNGSVENANMVNENITSQNIIENTVKENVVNENITSDNSQGNEAGIGGGDEGENLLINEVANEITKEASADEEQARPLTQMEIDANEIKNNYSFIVPLKGTISSRFGPRTATGIVSANHAGIDIAANEGTVFIAAMEGTVTYISGDGGYGNHVYIEKNDVTTLYAHCKTIYVKEGDTISQGEQIGEVGQTGNATGPHLHFEVRKENRVVNPEYILSF